MTDVTGETCEYGAPSLASKKYMAQLSLVVGNHADDRRTQVDPTYRHSHTHVVYHAQYLGTWIARYIDLIEQRAGKETMESTKWTKNVRGKPEVVSQIQRLSAVV
jgi:hypothetical protein